MTMIEAILRSKAKPKQKQIQLVKAVTSNDISTKDFFTFFESASDVDKGTCADVLKHVSEARPDMVVGYVDVLLKYVTYPAPRVRWGVPEAIGNLAKAYPEKAEPAIPLLLKNTADSQENTTVVKWCAAYALTEIAKHNPRTRRRLLPRFAEIIAKEQNNGVRNVYIKAIRAIENA